jgi:hypothetical protein
MVGEIDDPPFFTFDIGCEFDFGTQDGRGKLHWLFLQRLCAGQWVFFSFG